MKGWLQDCTFSTQQYSAPGTKPICGQCCQLVVKPAADDLKTNKQSAPLQLQQPLAQLLPAVQLSVSLPFSLPQSLAVSLSFFISFFLSFSLSLCGRILSVVGRLAAHTRLILGGQHRNLPLPSSPVTMGSDVSLDHSN